MAGGHLVEFVAVQQQVTLAVGGGVHVIANEIDVAERAADIFAQRLVVIARDQVDAHVVARFLEYLLHHRIVQFRPVNTAAHRPEIDDVANQKNILAVILSQQRQQLPGAARAGAEVNVRQKQRARPQCGRFSTI